MITGLCYICVLYLFTTASTSETTWQERPTLMEGIRAAIQHVLVMLFAHLTRLGRIPPDVTDSINYLDSQGVVVLLAVPAESTDADITYESLINNAFACAKLHGFYACEYLYYT
jgi:hypothetical protein